MKFILTFLTVFMTMFLLAVPALAQVPLPTPIDITPATNEQVLSWVFDVFSHEYSGMALVAIVVQGIMLFLGSPMAAGFIKEMTAQTKFFFVTGLSVLGSIAALMAGPAKLSFGAALMDGAVVASLMVLGHQFLKIYVFAKEEPLPQVQA